jgi:hypothetical protein
MDIPTDTNATVEPQQRNGVFYVVHPEMLQARKSVMRVSGVESVNSVSQSVS